MTSADTVVDIGTGTGVLAATAAMAGARHVYAVESTGMATLAKEVFAANGLSSRITVIEGRSTQIELPERADLMVSEIIGNDPLREGVMYSTQDAAKRLLKPDARLIPASLRIFGLPVTVPDKTLKKTLFTPEAVDRWRTWYGIDFSALAEASRNQDHARMGNTYHTRNWLRLCEPILLKEIDLRSQRDLEFRTTHRLRARHSGVLSGILIYFELALWDQVALSINPGEATPENSWASKLFIPGVSVALESGEEFKVIYTYARSSGSEFQVERAPGLGTGK